MHTIYHTPRFLFIDNRRSDTNPLVCIADALVLVNAIVYSLSALNFILELAIPFPLLEVFSKDPLFNFSYQTARIRKFHE